MQRVSGAFLSSRMAGETDEVFTRSTYLQQGLGTTHFSREKNCGRIEKRTQWPHPAEERAAPKEFQGGFMYERMLDRRGAPTTEEMAEYCGENAQLFSQLNDWLGRSHGTEQKAAFPYGNRYGWGIAHRIRKKLICNVFAEHGAFTVMMRLSDAQFASVYGLLCRYTQDCIDHRYPCGDGGWIHYRVTCRGHFDDAQKLLAVKLA